MSPRREADDVLADRYRRIRPLGRGGMGEVWLAWDELLDRQVAIKRIHAPLSGEARGVERIVREARVAARLQHPHAVTVHDLVFAGDEPHVVMQYVSGRTLAEVVADGPAPLHDAARLLGPVASALAEAHALGIVHRDVKPANVLIDSGGRPFLADFGIARSVSEATITQTGALLGTPAFLAPEVARGGEALQASDVYALGATLYCTIEGRAPFEDPGGNGLAVLARVLTEPAPSPTRAGELTHLLRSMLASVVADRPTAAEVADALSTFAGAPPSPPLVTRGRPAVRREGHTPTSPLQAVTRMSTAAPTTVATLDNASPDPVDLLMIAVQYADCLTGGASGALEEWLELISDGLAAALASDDRVELFVPTFFVLDQPYGLPQATVRSLRNVRLGATMALGDRVVSAWTAGSRSMTMAVHYDSIVGTHDLAGMPETGEFSGVLLDCGHFGWPIRFSDDKALQPLRRLFVGRVGGRVRPDWRSNRLHAWRVAESDGRWRDEPGWPADL